MKPDLHVIASLIDHCLRPDQVWLRRQWSRCVNVFREHLGVDSSSPASAMIERAVQHAAEIRARLRECDLNGGAIDPTLLSRSAEFDADWDAILDAGGDLDRQWLEWRKDAKENSKRGNSSERDQPPFVWSLTKIRDSWSHWFWRMTHVPQIKYDGDLPVHARVTEIAKAIQENQVVVVCGETGSGKSTQLPKICLEAGFGRLGMIGHTQPRRIAARSVAVRVAEELGVRLGDEVGYKIRFHDDTQPRSYIKLMTDGILLAETQGDRDFSQYDLIIIDEAHERSLNIDFLLGYLKQVCQRRPEFRLIITSATIDAERFAAHFPNQDGRPAPIITVEGRSFPVTIQYRSPEFEDGRWTNPEQAVVRAIQELATRDRGHVLVFLPTERDILSVSRKLRDMRLGRDQAEATEVVPLYARLSGADQQKIFQTTHQRRIVLATNVAESSLTVPGIKYVVDTGTARISRYSARSKVQRLPIEAISQASANQRAGRCGRVGPGVCLRLYSEEDFSTRDAFTTPEIRRTNLASVILQAKVLNLGPLHEFPFLDPPRPEAISEGEKSLFEIGAIDEKGDLTPTGRQLGKLPIDPRIGRMILEAAQQGCLDEILIIAAAIEVQDPRVRPVELAQAADQAHRQFQDKRSDFMSYLKVWQFYHEEKEKKSKTQFRKFLHSNFISPERMQQWIDVHRQLRQVVRELKLPLAVAPTNYASIHRSLLAGLLSGIGMLDEKEPKLKQFLGPGNVKFQLWPGTGLDRLPKWIMVAEIVETSRQFGRTVASIEPTWCEPLAGHLVKRRYSEAQWNPKSCGVMANERVTLFGLPIVPKRRVPYGRIDPRESQLLMFAEGFFLGNWEQPVPEFLERNWKTQAEIKLLSQKSRRSDWIIDEQLVVDFYASRFPPEVVDAATLNRFLKQASAEVLESLKFKLEEIIRLDDGYRPEDYPTVLDVGTAQLPLSYNFQPGENQDGVYVNVPAEALGQLSDQRLGWCVPGWIETKIVQMIRSLPKSVRRNLVPAPDTARRVALGLKYGHGSFYQEVAKLLALEAEVPLTVTDFDIEKIDAYLTMGIRVLDATGKTLAEGRSLAEVRRRLESQGVAAGQQIQDQSWQVKKQTDWAFGALPTTTVLQRGSIQVEAYPAVVDEGDTVGVGLFDNAGLAAWQQELGIVRLLRLTHHKQIKRQIRELPQLSRCQLLLSRWLSTAALEQGLESVLVKIVVGERANNIRDERAFRQLQQLCGAELGAAAAEVARWLPLLAQAVHQADQQLSEMKTNNRFIKAFNDARSQLRSLLAEGFLQQVRWQWLQQLPRFIGGVDYRLQRLNVGNAAVDQERMEAVAEYWERYEKQQERTRLENRIDPELEGFRWLIEEFRISLFAQPLGTSVKVSPQRLEKQWSQVHGSPIVAR
ncbi:MAG: ATP-dependent RNA helicase HrpA [Planctomycetaceae bacterium]|nr:ATP-dependent RNA helicase HrpA [Planctomycetaceae bacterium]